MKKRVFNIILTIIAFMLLLISVYIIDMNRMENNLPVLFSTWGYDYAPPEILGKVVNIQDTTLDGRITCAEALEKIFEDYENEYYLNCIKSSHIIVKYENGYEEDIKEALRSRRISIKDLDTFNINYIVEAKDTENESSFIGTVIEKGKAYIIVIPDETEPEFKSSDKINVSWDYTQGDYSVGSKVRVIYSGEIMETYPASITDASIFKID